MTVSLNLSVMDKRKTKIIYLIDTLSTGGRERCVLDLSNRINKDYFDVTIITLSNDKNDLLNEIAPDVTVWSIDKPDEALHGINVMFNWIIVLYKLVKLIKKEAPDIVHAHLMFHKLLLAALATKLQKKKIAFVNTVHTSGLYYERGGLINKFRLKIEKLAIKITKSNIVGISKIVYENNKKYFESANSNQYIANGVDIKKLQQCNISNVGKEIRNTVTDVVFIYVSRLDVGKNHRLLLDSWQQLIKEGHVGLKLILLGDGVLREEIETFIECQKLGNNVFVEGTVSNVAVYLKYADVGIFPSLFEGMPLSLIEKMAMGLPVIVSDIKVFKTIITDGNDGYFFKRDSADSLKKAILSFVKNPSLIRQMGDSAVITAEKYSINKNILKHEKLYKRLMS